MVGTADGLREYNRARVLDAVRDGATSRADVCAETGLARSTVTGLVRDLLAEGRVTDDSGPSAPGRSPGRPARHLRVAGRRHVVLAVDFGHSHCRVGAVAIGETDDAVVLAEHTSTLDVDAAPDESIAHAVRTARALLAPITEQPVAGAVGVPAPVDVRTGSVGTGNVLPRWVDRRPAEQLAEALGLPFLVDNDANLGALAEVSFGSARGVSDLIYVKAATGIGAGLLLGGRIHHGANGRAGEIGHVPIDPNGALCRCGNRGCLETMASVTQVLSAFQPRAGGPVSMAEVARLAEAGDPGALRVVSDAGRLIGRPLADLVNSLNPRRIVLGGQLATAGQPLLDGVREAVGRFAQPGLTRDLVISLSTLQGSAELLGAAALATRLVPDLPLRRPPRPLMTSAVSISQR